MSTSPCVLLQSIAGKSLLTERFARHFRWLVTSIYLHPADEDLDRSVQKIRC